MDNSFLVDKEDYDRFLSEVLSHTYFLQPVCQSTVYSKWFNILDLFSIDVVDNENNKVITIHVSSLEFYNLEAYLELNNRRLSNG